MLECSGNVIFCEMSSLLCCPLADLHVPNLHHSNLSAINMRLSALKKIFIVNILLLGVTPASCHGHSSKIFSHVGVRS